MSALFPYSRPARTSGAMFRGEPSMVVVIFSLPRILAKPKSAILMVPSCLRMLASLKSLCMMLFFTSVLKAFRIWTKYSTASSSENFWN